MCFTISPKIDIRGITPHDNYAHPLVEFRCAREMICNAIRAEKEGYDAFVVGHFQDAGLYEARSAVDIPVIALGEASMLYSCQLGQRCVGGTPPLYAPPVQFPTTAAPTPAAPAPERFYAAFPRCLQFLLLLPQFCQLTL